MSAFCDVGFAIRAVRSARGMSQDTLAAKVHTSRPAVNSYENRRKLPTLPTLERIAKALRVTMPQLITIATATTEALKR